MLVMIIFLTLSRNYDWKFYAKVLHFVVTAKIKEKNL